MNILVLGNPEDVHATHMKQALQQAGAIVDYFDAHLFPTQLRLSWQPDTQEGQIALSAERQFQLADVHCVFWRQLSSIQIPMLADLLQRSIAYEDSMSLLRSLMQAVPTRWINSWQAYQFHKEKPLQLSTVKQLGVAIPPTLISNDPDQVLEFVRSQERVIFKPVYGGAHTQLLTEEHLHPKRLSLALSLSPATFQELILGTNIRSYVIGGAVYSAEIRTAALDFREDTAAELIPCQLPQPVEQQCREIARALLLKWTAIDWRLRPTGEYAFLEANPSPMFLHFEQQTGFPITEALVQLLISNQDS
jgi:glutathione synthase/RimK-type ligase-like ATP-grasp enzyme